jgi:hypothetical protein
VTIKGTGWSPNDLIDFCWNFNCDPTDTSVKADGSGTFTGTITVPQDAPIGNTYIDAGSQAKFITAQAPFTITTATTGTSPAIVRVETFRAGVLVYFRLFYADPNNTAEGFGFKGANGSGWAKETHPFSSPSYGRWSPGKIEYPFNHLCGEPGEYASDVEAWIYDSAGQSSQSVTIHLACSVSPSENYNSGKYTGKAGFVSVGSYKEPDNQKYWNYCGPGASQVLISAWTDTVPDIDTLAEKEKTNQGTKSCHTPGTCMSDMVKPVNDAIGQNYYTDENHAGSQEKFSNMIGEDIFDNGHPLITALQTRDEQGNKLKGWNNRPAPHIVTITGFNFTSPTQGWIYYTETASKGAGAEDGPGPYRLDYNTFWALVRANNVQLHGK